MLTSMTQWEYRIVSREGWLGGDKPVVAVMDTIGAEGWELVSVQEKFLWFKRPKEDKLG